MGTSSGKPDYRRGTGRKLGLRAYRFLEGPLVRRFGREWYDELVATCDEYLRQFGGDDAPAD